jgi:hypothetical protein
MSRQPIGKGDRVTIILNPAFPKEKVILKYFEKSLNRSADIKEILYNHAIRNRSSNNDNQIINDCTINDNSIIKECSINDNLMVNELSKNDNKITNQLTTDNNNCNNDFSINLDNIKDEVIKVEHDPEEEAKQANNNALDFLKKGF